MKRHWVFAIAALTLLSRPGHAQNPSGWGPRFRITPFVGVSPGVDQKGFAAVITGSSVSSHQYTWNMASSVPLGLNAEYRFYNRFGIVGGGMWLSRGDGRLDDFEDQVSYATTGSNYLIFKLAPKIYLREQDPEMQLKRLNASAYVGPAFIHDSPKGNLAIPALNTTSINSWGLNIGADGELPLADTRFGFQVGLDDVITFWDEGKYAERMRLYLNQEITGLNAVVINANKTHLFTGRVGLSFRF